eukprot:9489185-Heterocapsa_arctica.AAC.1
MNQGLGAVTTDVATMRGELDAVQAQLRFLERRPAPTTPLPPPRPEEPRHSPPRGQDPLHSG